MPITFAENGEFDGEATVTLPISHRVTSEAVNCAGETSVEIMLRARGRVQEDGQVPLILDLGASQKGGDNLCSTPIGPIRQPIPAGPRFDSSRNTSLQAEVGATGRADGFRRMWRAIRWT